MSDNRQQTRFRTDEFSVAANDEDRAEKSSAVNMPVHFVWDYTKWKSRKKWTDGSLFTLHNTFTLT